MKLISVIDNPYRKNKKKAKNSEFPKNGELLNELFESLFGI